MIIHNLNCCFLNVTLNESERYHIVEDCGQQRITYSCDTH